MNMMNIYARMQSDCVHAINFNSRNQAANLCFGQWLWIIINIKCCEIRG